MAPETKEVSHVPHSHRVGLVLSGGGARGAYQAGVVKAVADISTDAGLKQPFPILTGVSAGAINAAVLAASAHHFADGADQLAQLWSRLRSEQIFRTNVLSAGRSGFRFISDATVGALYQRKLARSLLDTTPLRKLLVDTIPFENITRNIANGHLESLAVTAMNYSSGASITFVQGEDDVPTWIRARRRAERAIIITDHVMASSAIPLFFPPVKVGDQHFGDGCLRNTCPLSPAIHLGADRILVVSVRRPDTRVTPAFGSKEPSLARVIGIIMNALLLDAIDVDMERLSRVNQTLDFVSAKQQEDLQLRKIDYLWLRPSRDIGAIASDMFEKLPRVIRYLISGLGTSSEASELTSYLLFDPDYCGQLVRMGYEDAMENRKDICRFLNV